MIAVMLPDTFGVDYLRWKFEERKDGNRFKNKAEAINYLQAVGMIDSEIGRLHFVTIGE